MTEEAVREALHMAIVAAVTAGARNPRRNLRHIQDTATIYADLVVLPVTRSLEEQAAEDALRAACEPWQPGAIMEAPSPASPLWQVWVAGAVAAIDALAKALGVQLSDPQLVGDDTAELVAAEIRMLLDEARQGSAPKLPG